MRVTSGKNVKSDSIAAGAVAESQLPGFASLEQQAFLNLWRTYDRLKALEDELFGRRDLTAQQYNSLRLLQAAGPAGLQTLTLAARLISRAPDITRLLDKLEDRKLVRRDRRPENRRVVQVAIMPAGERLLDALASEVLDCHERQLGHLSEDNLHALVELLRAARLPHEQAGDSSEKSPAETST
ncbi:MAG TPA: MarR family winged helix-turn-helix transcriptional regulator [Pirellulales bacterium]|jgi:DNA-binding MarR family transcriptional regulator